MVIRQLVGWYMLAEEVEDEAQVAMEPGVSSDIFAQKHIELAMTCSVPKPRTIRQEEHITE